jgi:hypothetical protein
MAMKNLGTIAGAAAFVAAMSFAGTASATEIWALTGINDDSTFTCDSRPDLFYNNGSGPTQQNGTVGPLVIDDGDDGADLPGIMRTGINYDASLSQAQILNSCESVTIQYELPDNGTELGYANCTASWRRAGAEISNIKHDGSLLDNPNASIFATEGVWLPVGGTEVGDTGFVLIASNPHTVQLIADARNGANGIFGQTSPNGLVSFQCEGPLIAVASSAGGSAGHGGRIKGNSPQRVYSGSVGLTTEAVVEGELIVHYWNTPVGGAAEDFKCTWTPSVVFYDDAGPAEKATVGRAEIWGENLANKCP